MKKDKKSCIFSMINLGCTKNLVDSQFLLGKILSTPEILGHHQTKSPKIPQYHSDPYDPSVDLVFLNTCGFISSGRQEALQTIQKLLKKDKKICIIGCGVQYREKLLK